MEGDGPERIIDFLCVDARRFVDVEWDIAVLDEAQTIKIRFP